MTAVPTITTTSGRAGPCASSRCAGADHGDPAVGAQPRRMVVAVARGPASAVLATTQRGAQSKHSSICSSARRRTASPATTQPSMDGGAGTAPPGAFGQLVDVVQELGAMGQQPGAAAGAS